MTKGERGGAKGERLFTMYSLGDMTPVEGTPRVKEIFETDAERPIDVVKMAHQGSDANIAALPPEITNENMIMLFSGFTGKGSENDRGALERFLMRQALYSKEIENSDEEDEPPTYKWKEVYILYADERYACEVADTTLGQKLLKAGFKFAQDYVVRITPSGEAYYHATLWE